MLGDPGFLFGTEGRQVALQQQAGIATAPAAQDVQPFAFTDAGQCLVDQLAQVQVVAGQGERERFGGGRGKVVDLQRALEAFADHEVGTDGVAQVGVGLAQFDSGQPGQGGAVQAQLRLGVQAAYGIGGQVVINHGQAQAGQVGRALQAAPLPGHDHRQVVGIG